MLLWVDEAKRYSAPCGLLVHCPLDDDGDFIISSPMVIGPLSCGVGGGGGVLVGRLTVEALLGAAGGVLVGRLTVEADGDDDGIFV